MAARVAAGSEAYGAFAYAYDQALGTRFFAAVKRMLDDVLARYPTPKRSHLDLACGTGLALQYFRKAGWTSVGIDGSVEMLQIARGRASRLAAADFRALPLRATFARVTCLYDSLNHLLDYDDLAATFKAVQGVMAHDSLFLFDMNHPDIYPAVWGMAEPFESAGPDHKLTIATTYRAREKMAKALVRGWAAVGGERTEIHELRRQRAYSEREIVSALAAAGLTPVDVIDFDPYQESELVEGGVKLFFVCRRV
ncbi:MAG TPA: class I SAM-dependent methyltransferase [Thermoanaerobaculia bacterium]